MSIRYAFDELRLTPYCVINILMNRSHESGDPVSSPAETDAITVDKLIDVLSNVKAEDEELYQIITDTFLLPEPDPNDPEAVAKYAELISMAKSAAFSLQERSARTLEIQELLRDFGVEIPGLPPNN